MIVKKIIAIALALIVALSLTVSLSATALGSKGFVPFKLSGGSGSGSGSGDGGSGENSGEEPTTPAPTTEPTTKAPCNCGKEDCTCNDNEHCTCNETTTKKAEENTTKNDDEAKKQTILDKVKALLQGAKLPEGMDADKIMDALKKLDLATLMGGLGSGDFSLDTVINFVKGLIGGGDKKDNGTTKAADPTTQAPAPTNAPTTSPYVPCVNTGDVA